MSRRRCPKDLLLTDAAQVALPALREAFGRLGEAASMLTAAVDGRRVIQMRPGRSGALTGRCYQPAPA
jgi:hypothetical protein